VEYCRRWRSCASAGTLPNGVIVSSADDTACTAINTKTFTESTSEFTIGDVDTNYGTHWFVLRATQSFYDTSSSATLSRNVDIHFAVQVRQPGCGLSTASNYQPGFETHPDKWLADNTRCTFAPVTVDASSNTPVNVNLGDFTGFAGAMDGLAESLAAQGQTVEKIAAALAGKRAAARGTVQVTINPSSLQGAGSVAVTNGMLNAAGVEQLRRVPGAPADLSLVLKLGPSGTTFSKPVTVCMFVGDTPSGSFQVLKTASELDSGGYGPVTALANQVFNAASGKLCGDTTHFSAFFPAAQPLPTVDTVPKAHLMGGACPNSCSGHGFCRQEGKCACFAGYTGYDCSIRTCPSGASWGEVALGVDNAPVHVDSECSGRGVCDRTSALCACFTGYEGAACERQACPNKCSSHGKCRFLAELPNVAATAYSSWEARRVQKCVCDGGFTGADCSQRTCPYGDDPETICRYETHQVQTLTLAYPTIASADPPSPSDYDNNELALVFTSVEGMVFTTPALRDLTVQGAAELEKALESLPAFAVSNVTVTAATSNTDSSIVLKITFTGDTNTGNEELLRCAFNSDGYTLGCPAAGCQPKFKQPRVFKSDKPYVGFDISKLSVLEHAAPYKDANAGKWAVETTLSITKSASGYTYSFTGTKSWGDSNDSANIAETPVPAERGKVEGPYGLLIDFKDDMSALNLGVNSFTFKWMLPDCKVSATPADKDLEKAECSNRGVCDRTSGQCTCFDGYSGSTCNAQVIVV